MSKWFISDSITADTNTCWSMVSTVGEANKSSMRRPVPSVQTFDVSKKLNNRFICCW